MTGLIESSAEPQRGRATDRCWRDVWEMAFQTAAAVARDPDLAADCAQEVVVIALRHRGRVRDPDAFPAWVHRVAVRETLKRMRADRRRADIEAAAAVHDAAHVAQDDRGWSAASHALDLLARLPQRERVAMTLHYVHDLDGLTIARAMRCPPVTVRVLLHRGRKRLRRLMENSDE